MLPELRGRLHGVAVRVPVEDASLTDLTVNLARPATADKGMAKVFGWYDNEWGYANRTLDLVHLMAGTL